MKLTSPAAPQANDFAALKAGLTGYNESFTGTVFKEKISSFLKDDTGIIVGGILSEINWNWMHIQGLWVDESVRMKGWGAKLLSLMEDYALSKNTTNIRLETTTFQALEFYVKAGYSVFGELPNMPQGHTSYFLQKQLGI
jgi:ribosomal protein S18 acetylase RimI-like enzyme